MRNKRDIVIASVAFLFGLGIMYVYGANEIAANKSKLATHDRVTREIMDNCSRSLSDSQILIDSCSTAYTAATSCVSHLNTCDVASVAKNLTLLNDRKNNAEIDLESATKNLGDIFHELTEKQQ